MQRTRTEQLPVCECHGLTKRWKNDKARSHVSGGSWVCVVKQTARRRKYRTSDKGLRNYEKHNGWGATRTQRKRAARIAARQKENHGQED